MYIAPQNGPDFNVNKYGWGNLISIFHSLLSKFYVIKIESMFSFANKIISISIQLYKSTA